MASGYFMLSGVLSAVLIAVAVYLFATGAVTASPALIALSLVLRIGMTIAFFWTASLLSRRSRRARVVLAIIIVLPVIQMILTAAADAMMIVWTILSVIVLAVIWRDLNQ